MTRRLTLIAALSLTLSPALAQSTLVEVQDETVVAPFGQRADTVDDWDVYTSSGAKIGDVDEVLGPDVATATALAIDFEGKAGYADRDVAVPLERFIYANGRLVLNASADEIAKLPAWDD